MIRFCKSHKKNCDRVDKYGKCSIGTCNYDYGSFKPVFAYCLGKDIRSNEGLYKKKMNQYDR